MSLANTFECNKKKIEGAESLFELPNFPTPSKLYAKKREEKKRNASVIFSQLLYVPLVVSIKSCVIHKRRLFFNL